MDATAQNAAQLGWSDTFVRALVDRHRASGMDAIAAIEASHEEFQRLAKEDADSGCRLMIALWPIAADQYMHHVCDNIDLWLDDKMSPQLATYIKAVVDAESDPDLKRRYSEWLPDPKNA